MIRILNEPRIWLGGSLGYDSFAALRATLIKSLNPLDNFARLLHEFFIQGLDFFKPSGLATPYRYLAATIEPAPGMFCTSMLGLPGMYFHIVRADRRPQRS